MYDVLATEGLEVPVEYLTSSTFCPDASMVNNICVLDLYLNALEARNLSILFGVRYPFITRLNVLKKRLSDPSAISFVIGKLSILALNKNLPGSPQ